MILDDGGDATLLVHLGTKAGEGSVGHCESDQRGREVPVRGHQEEARREPGLVLEGVEGNPRRHRRNDDRCASSLSDAQGGKLMFPGINVNDSVTIEVRQPLRLP